jgi:hypothetical protein
MFGNVGKELPRRVLSRKTTDFFRISNYVDTNWNFSEYRIRADLEGSGRDII